MSGDIPKILRAGVRFFSWQVGRVSAVGVLEIPWSKLGMIGEGGSGASGWLAGTL